MKFLLPSRLHFSHSEIRVPSTLPLLLLFMLSLSLLRWSAFMRGLPEDVVFLSPHSFSGGPTSPVEYKHILLSPSHHMKELRAAHPLPQLFSRTFLAARVLLAFYSSQGALYKRHGLPSSSFTSCETEEATSKYIHTYEHLENMEGGNPPPRNRPQPLANDPFDEDEIAKRANDGVPRQRTASVGHGFQVQGSVADFDPGTLKTGSVSGNFALPMSWRKLNYSAGELRILCGLTGTALPGRCLAILGSSGAGKTTFLNAICDRLAEDRHLKLSGRRQLGDVEYERHYRKAMGFVAQDDIVSSLSTPYDALWFSLRTRRGTDRAETEARVQEALEVLRLQHCRDTKIGIPGLEAGLSGGERKRCNIGIELIVDPKILLLDEPTSGLDSVTSAKVVHLLRQLSRMGRTIIYTIHQPTAEVLSYFDDLMLMTQGRVAYHGTMAASLGYFESIGFPCPEKYTPTDYFMVMLQDPVTSTILIKRWRKYLKNGPRSPHTAAVRLAKSRSESSAAKFLDAYIKKFGSSPFVQFYELTRRSVIEISRDRLYIFSLASQATFFAVVVGLVFLHVRDNVEGIQDREGMLFMTVMNRAMGSTFIMIDAFERVRAVYTREQQAGAYSPLLYYVGRSLAEFPLQIFFIFVECAILYWMVGLYRKPGEFFYYFGAISMVSQVASGLGFAISSSFPSLLIAAAITPLILLPLAMAGGLFASTERLRPYWYWLEKPSFMRHGYILVLRNELNNVRNVACNNYNKGDAYCINQARDGKVVLRLLGFDGDPQSTDVWMWVSLAILFFVFRFISIIALNVAGRAKM